MKKVVSLLLAGLLGLSMTVSALAGSVIPVFGNQGVIINGQHYVPVINGPTPPVGDEIDPGCTYPQAPNFPNWSGVICPTAGCYRICKVYELNTIVGTQKYAKCSVHGLQVLPVEKPDTDDENAVTYKVYVDPYKGGSVKLGDSCTNVVQVKAGSDLNVEIIPDYGYEIDAVYINGYYCGTEDNFVLENIGRNVRIRVLYRAINIYEVHTIKASANENGSVYAAVDGKSVGTIGTLSGTYANQVTLYFNPVNNHYKVESVIINGVNVGPVSSYDVGRMRSSLNITANFAWINPYTDLDKDHLDAVEYVTEIDVMGAISNLSGTNAFHGTNNVTVKAVACYLAELSDVDDTLDSVAERVAWAAEKGLVAADANLNVLATWQKTAEMVSAYLRVLEKDSNVTFAKLENLTSAWEIADALDVVDELTYHVNKNITRYDMAEICYAISLLEIK